MFIMESFIDELKWRGLIHDSTPGIEDFLSTKKGQLTLDLIQRLILYILEA